MSSVARVSVQLPAMSPEISLPVQRGVGGLSATPFYGPPVVATVTPPSGAAAGGYQTTISGLNMAYVTSVKFDGTDATVVSWDGTSLVVNVPAGIAGPADIYVETLGGSHTLLGGFAYT